MHTAIGLADTVSLADPAAAKRRKARLLLDTMLANLIDEISQPGAHGKREITLSFHDGMITSAEVVERTSHKFN